MTEVERHCVGTPFKRNNFAKRNLFAIGNIEAGKVVAGIVLCLQRFTFARNILWRKRFSAPPLQ